MQYNVEEYNIVIKLWVKMVEMKAKINLHIFIFIYRLTDYSNVYNNWKIFKVNLTIDWFKNHQQKYLKTFNYLAFNNQVLQ